MTVAKYPPKTPLSADALVRLRRSIGLPDDGPTEAQRAAWRAHEIATARQDREWEAGP